MYVSRDVAPSSIPLPHPPAGSPTDWAPDPLAGGRPAGPPAALGRSVRPSSAPQLLGQMPAIGAGEADRRFDRRAVSRRWLGGVGLVALLGVGLIGFALFVSLHGELDVAEAPRAAYVGGNSSEPLPRGDALAARATVVGARRAFKAPFAHLSGGREITGTASFLRLSTRLLPASVGLEADVPPLHQADLIREEGTRDEPVEPIDASPQDSEPEVSTTFEPLPVDLLESGPELPDDAAARQAQSAADSARGMQPVTSFSPQLALGRSIIPTVPRASADPAPFASMDVRIVPENMTEITRQPGGRAARRATAVEVAPGEALAEPLRQAGATDAEAEAFAQALGRTAGRVAATLTAEFVAPGEPPGLARVSLKEGDRVMATVALADDGRVVPVYAADPAYGVGSGLLQRLAGEKIDPPQFDGSDENGRDEGTSLYQSLYQTALVNDIPKETIAEVLRLFAFDVDLERAVGPDDRIDLLATEDPDGRGRPTLLYAALVLGRETIAYWRAQQGGSTVFVDSEGRSNKRMIVSKPITEARLTSGFGSRYHPVLHYTRPHNGIDWANKVGTPIFAAGDGEVIEAGWHSGYGRHVEIRHPDGFVTTYSHMSALARGLEPGEHVRLGQTIGALGQSGLATGPHLHFEVKLNGAFVNPLTVRVPRASHLDGSAMEQFRHDRGQIDRVLACSQHGACQGPA